MNQKAAYMKKWRVWMVLLLGSIWMASVPAWAGNWKQGHILVVTSNNPETKKINENISEFMEQFRLRGGQLDNVIIESLNCKSLQEARQWKRHMASILQRHSGHRTPALVLLLGQEALAAYLSQDTEWVKKVPVMCGLTGCETVELPGDTVDLKTWNPECRNIFSDFKDFNIVGGMVYRCDADKNLHLMRRFYPRTDTLAFLSDNTLGGVVMRSWFQKEVREFPGLKLKWLDGRQSTLQQICNRLQQMDAKNSCLMIGTWRIDSSDNYIMDNTTYLLRESNSQLPSFAIASTGLGHWALGGYVPENFVMGRRLADQVCDFLQTGKSYLEVIPCHYVFDARRLKLLDISFAKLPKDARLINKTPAFYEENPMLLLGIVSAFLLLCLGLIISFFYIRHINLLRNKLELQSKELLTAKDRSEEANRLKTAFLANMSHEIRTPLNAIVGFSELLANGEVEDEGSRMVYGEIVRKNSDLLLHLVNDILDIARIESGRIKLEYSICNVVELCRMALVTVEQTKRTEARFEEDFPVQFLEINTDPQRLRQVLINLLTNASKFTKEGFIRLAFRIDEEQRLLEFSVTDTGCGIPPEKVDKVFERFEKLNEYAQGAGLGLSICKLIVEKLGGNIRVDKKYTGGARFVFTHPYIVGGVE